MMGLTNRQRDILRFIASSTERLGYPPTRREICDRFGFRSSNAASDHLSAIERKGFIRVVPEIARGIVLTERGRAWVSPPSEVAP